MINIALILGKSVILGKLLNLWEIQFSYLKNNNTYLDEIECCWHPTSTRTAYHKEFKR